MTIPRPSDGPDASAQARDDLATALTKVADRLHRASSLGEFMAAIDTHRQIWRRLAGTGRELAPLVPRPLAEFCLDVVARPNRRLGDAEIESLIHANRYVASALSKGLAA